MVKKMFTSLESLLSETIAGEAGDYAIAVKNLFSGRCWQINTSPMRAASLIKIYIMIEAFNRYAQGNLNLSEHQLVPSSLKVGGAGSLQYAPENTSKTWLELIELMIIESDNIATNLLIDKLTMPAVNSMIEALGCNATVLRRKMMDFASAGAGRENLTTVEDIALVLKKIYLRRCLGTEQDTAMLNILLRQEDKCKLPVLLPKNVPIAHKTGELEGAEHDAGIVYGKDCHYIIAVMTDSLPDATRGKAIISKISLIVYDYLHTLSPKIICLGEFKYGQPFRRNKCSCSNIMG